MEINNIYYSSHFQRAFQKLPEEIQKKAVFKERIFRKDCFDNRLKTHKLKGKLDPYWSFPLDPQFRILFSFEENGSAVFIDTGNHSVYF